jgi:hypothetical protein
LTTTAVNLTTDHSLTLADATAGAFSIYLPAASASRGRVLTFKKTDASANAVTIDADGAETIDGATTITLSGRYDQVTITSDGTEWWEVAIGEPWAFDFDAYDSTGGQIVAGAAVTLNLNVETVDVPTDSFTLAGDEVTVNRSGYADLSFQVTIGSVGSGDYQADAWLEMDTGGGFAEVAGTRCKAGKGT